MDRERGALTMSYTEVRDPMTGKPSEAMIQRDADQAFIPFDEGNRDYQEYKAWLADGNAPKPATPPATGKSDG
jgi:hypothetical protein